MKKRVPFSLIFKIIRPLSGSEGQGHWFAEGQGVPMILDNRDN